LIQTIKWVTETGTPWGQRRKGGGGGAAVRTIPGKGNWFFLGRNRITTLQNLRRSYKTKMRERGGWERGFVQKKLGEWIVEHPKVLSRGEKQDHG